jgi:AcrR family transcriptional regulator
MPSDDEFMRATWRALCVHGYADLTMQDIADESEKSKAALHYHYGGKQDLLESFLDHVAERFLSRLRDADAAAGPNPDERLGAVVDAAFSPPESDELESTQRALVELKAQAPHQPPFRERIQETDAAFRELLVDIVTAGVETGDFQSDVDPGETAQFVVNALAGAQLRQVSVGEEPTTARRVVEQHLERHVHTDGGASGE